ncbi:hypothetical protein LOTGIDRAFT_168396 [Lottia gigantea]|uniref:BHLH domain-containing protein n=1 Tax=Lottia gigantea TaxID=225164 RepID=V3ZKD2_LOTGI|nr:hypothetical protein LOTGIDRAFT_168396 [Lottia gigantea]ESO84732.1 hypothetical protein LOTGIDRAFT_168396 [Lottia gigantea]
MDSKSFSSFRKGRKLLAEKKRRNRINEYLNQIKSLLTEDQNVKTDLGENKMEKVEILESAVEFIKKTKYSPDVKDTRENQTIFKTGFSRCVQEMMCFLNGVTEISDNVKYHLVQHVTRNIQPTQNNKNCVQYPTTTYQYINLPEYRRYNSSLAVPIDISTEHTQTIDVNNNMNIVWRPW